MDVEERPAAEMLEPADQELSPSLVNGLTETYALQFIAFVFKKKKKKINQLQVCLPFVPHFCFLLFFKTF